MPAAAWSTRLSRSRTAAGLGVDEADEGRGLALALLVGVVGLEQGRLPDHPHTVGRGRHRHQPGPLEVAGERGREGGPRTRRVDGRQGAEVEPDVRGGRFDGIDSIERPGAGGGLVAGDRRRDPGDPPVPLHADGQQPVPGGVEVTEGLAEGHDVGDVRVAGLLAVTGASQVGAVEERGVTHDLESAHGVLREPEQVAVVEHEPARDVGRVAGPGTGEVAVLVEEHLWRTELVPPCGGRAERLRGRLLCGRRGHTALTGVGDGDAVAVLPLEGEGDAVEVGLGRALSGRRQDRSRQEQSEGGGAEEGEPPTPGVSELCTHRRCLLRDSGSRRRRTAAS